MAIKSIHTSDVQRITSGQVIVDLVSIVKELVENAIDSGAGKIEILFKNNGLDSIEVIDDGCGIDKEDFKNICIKHCTSKLSSYEDLHDVHTLGFRGEALSSLSAISNLKIVTCTKNELPRASELEFNSMGQLVSEKKKIGGNKGTTVTIKNIFHNLPVRSKNLQNNIKREFSKAMSFLTNYLIIYPNIRFSIYNVNKSNKKNLILGTIGTKKATILDNLVTIFGSNGSYGLSPIEIEVNDLEAKFKFVNEEYPTMKKLNIKIEGYISNSSFGMGRSSADRQFLYINKRPIILKKFLKTVNEVYKTFNHIQIPAVILNIDIEPAFLDINVTPDKRTVLIHNEDLINDILRNELTNFYDNQGNIIPKNKQQEISFAVDMEDKNKKIGLSGNTKELKQKDLRFEKLSSNENNCKNPSTQNLNENDENTEGESDSELNNDETIDVIKTNDKVVSKNKIKASDIQENGVDEDCNVDEENSQVSLESNESNGLTENSREETTQKNEDISDLSNSLNEDDLFSSDVKTRTYTSSISNLNETVEIEENRKFPDDHVSKRHISRNKNGSGRLFVDDLENESENEASFNRNDRNDQEEKGYSLKIIIGNDSFEESLPKRAKLAIPATPTRTSLTKQITSKSEIQFLSSFMTLNPKDLKSNSMTMSTANNSINTTKKPKVDSISSEDAEDKLSYIISKQDFLKMKVIGQFNLGFILVTLNSSNNLFILDQHASDEKFNFEKLTKTTQFQSQPLVLPKTIELNVMDEITVNENMEVFKQNGFNIRFDEESAPGSRIKLLALPMSKNTIFDINDFHELIHLVKVNTNTSLSNSFIKCSKIRSIIAMRACRSSIMVGQHLNRNTMKNVVANLNTLEKPWNCPHGRPTMRHLIELKDWPAKNFDYEL